MSQFEGRHRTDRALDEKNCGHESHRRIDLPGGHPSASPRRLVGQAGRIDVSGLKIRAGEVKTVVFVGVLEAGDVTVADDPLNYFN